MIRVIAGSAGGRSLRVPVGRSTRPTADRAREGLFSSLGDLAGLSVLDLYAGSGAVGLEALSRGAALVTLVDSDGAALQAIRANVEALALPGATVVGEDVGRFLTGDPSAYAGPFDVVFLDPPYADPVATVLAAVVPWVADRVVVERASRDAELTWPDGLRHGRSRRYGEATLWYGARS